MFKKTKKSGVYKKNLNTSDKCNLWQLGVELDQADNIFRDNFFSGKPFSG